MKRNEALAILRAEQEHLRRDFGVKLLILFGSVARDQAKAIGHKLSFFRPCQALQFEGSAAVRWGFVEVQQPP